MDTSLVQTFDKYKLYAEKTCDAWTRQSDSVILPSLILPHYTKMDKLSNQLRAVSGKYVLKATLMARGLPDERDGSQYHTTYGSSMWKLFFKLGAHEWNRMLLQGYSLPANFDTNAFVPIIRLAERAIGGFESWRTLHHPNCPISVAEQASRIVWFAVAWAILQGRSDLSLADLEGIWNYAMLYPYVDNFLDSVDPKDKIHRYKFLQDLRQCLKTEVTSSIAQFSYHPNRQELLASIRVIKEWTGKQQPMVADEFLNSLQILTVIEGAQRLNSSEEALLHSCLKGSLALIPICLLTTGYVDVSDYGMIFNYGLALQLIDDMQDMSQDVRDRIPTLFTQSSPSTNTLSATVIKTLNFISTQLSYQGIFINIKLIID